MSEWPFEKLGALCDRVSVGHVGPTSEYFCEAQNGVALVRSQNVRPGRLTLEDVAFITPEFHASLKKSQLRPGDVLVVRVGQNRGDVCRVPDWWAGPLNCANVVFARPRTIDSRFVELYLRSAAGQASLISMTTGSAQGVLNTRSVAEVEVPVPPIGVQHRIGSLLGAIDDKIEQNRRTGRKLEELARAVFKAWFVDFEPVKAKAAGATAFPGMPPETFATLPNTLKDSPLGPIPEGWEVGTIKDRASAIQYGLTTSATEEAIGPQFLRITDIRGGAVDWGTVPYCMATAMDAQKYRLIDGDIVVARTGASTGENMYLIDPPDCVFASYLVRFQFADRGVARLVGAFMRTEIYRSFVTGSIGGSAQPNANAQTLASSPLVFPPVKISNAYYDFVHPLDLKRAADARESAKLATLRDYLLPRLLSGRVRVAGTQ